MAENLRQLGSSEAIGPATPTNASRSATSPKDDPLTQWIRHQLETNHHNNIYDVCLNYFERVLLPLVMTHVQGSQSRAARILGMTRRTLRNKLRNAGLLPDTTSKDEIADSD